MKQIIIIQKKCHLKNISKQANIEMSRKILKRINWKA